MNVVDSFDAIVASACGVVALASAKPLAAVVAHHQVAFTASDVEPPEGHTPTAFPNGRRQVSHGDRRESRRLSPAGVGLAFVVTLAGAAAALGYRLGAVGWLPMFLYLTAIGITLGRIDLCTRRLPDRLVLPSYGVVGALLAAGAVVERDASVLLAAVANLAVLWGFYFVFYLASRGHGFGFGDVKLGGLLGLGLGPLGPGASVFALVVIHLLAGVAVLLLVVTRRAGRGSTMPFGPFMVAGWLATVLLLG